MTWKVVGLNPDVVKRFFLIKYLLKYSSTSILTVNLLIKQVILATK